MYDPLYLPIERRRDEITRYAAKYGCRTFVETGTADGSTTEAMMPYFDKLYTIEIDPGMWMAACNKFASTDNVTCLLGDSGNVLHAILSLLEEPTIFWLDGHYCGGPTRGEEDSPVIKELEACWQAPSGSVILIDDARIFGGGAEEGLEGYTGYPHQDWVMAQAFEHNYVPVIYDDIIRLTPGYVQNH